MRLLQGMVAAADAVRRDILAAAVLTLAGLVVVIKQRGDHSGQVAHQRQALDVDMPAGQAGSQAGVLALLADGQGQLVVGDDDGGVVGVLVNHHVADLGGRQGVGHIYGRVVVPLDDIDALVAQLLDDHPHPRAFGANAGTHRVEVVLPGMNGYLGAGAGLAGYRLYLHNAVVDLRHLNLEQPPYQVGVGAADDYRGPGILVTGVSLQDIRVADLDNQRLQALVVAVMLVGRLLVALVLVALDVEMGQLGLHAVADLDNSEVRCGLQHGAADQLALAVGVLGEDGLAPGVADYRQDDVLGVLRRYPADVARRDVALLELAVLASLLVRLAHRHHLIYIDVASLPVDGDAGVPFQVEDILVALGQGLL